MLDPQAITKAIDDACLEEIGKQIGVLYVNLATNVSGAEGVFERNLRFVIQANQIGKRVATSVTRPDERA
jgi:hypothetical protein